MHELSLRLKEIAHYPSVLAWMEDLMVGLCCRDVSLRPWVKLGSLGGCCIGYDDLDDDDGDDTEEKEYEEEARWRRWRKEEISIVNAEEMPMYN